MEGLRILEKLKVETGVIFLELPSGEVIGLALAGIVELGGLLVTIAVTMLASQCIFLPELLRRLLTHTVGLPWECPNALRPLRLPIAG